MARKKKQAEEQAVAEVPTPKEEVAEATETEVMSGSPAPWRSLVDGMAHGFGIATCTNERGGMTEMQRNECAALVEVSARAITKQFLTLSRKAAQNDGAAVKAGMALTLDRSGGSTTHVSAHLSASEKWIDVNEQTDVCDPEQELPLYAEAAEAEALAKELKESGAELSVVDPGGPETDPEAEP